MTCCSMSAAAAAQAAESAKADASAAADRVRRARTALRDALSELAAANEHRRSVDMRALFAAELSSRCALGSQYSAEVYQLAETGATRTVRWRRVATRMLRLMSGTYQHYRLTAEKRSSRWDGQIDKDMPRTLVGLMAPAASAVDVAQLREVLRAWVARGAEERLGVGYVQGMNLRCAIPLAVLGDTELAFGLSAACLENAALPQTFASWPPLAGALAARDVLTEEVAAKCPELAAGLGTAGLASLMGLLTPRWLIPLFAGALPYQLVLHVWDDVVDAMAEDPGCAGWADTVALKWALGLLKHFELQILAAVFARALQVEEELALPKEVVAYQVVNKGCAALPADWQPPDWPVEQQALRKRHGELLQALRGEAEAGRLAGGAVALSQMELRALRAEFEQLRRAATAVRRSAEVDIVPQGDGLDDIGLRFTPGLRTVLAVWRPAATDPKPAVIDGETALRSGLGSFTGWQLRAVDGAAVAGNADLQQPWGRWTLARWEFRSERGADWEPFAALDACALEDSHSAGEDLVTRGLTFNEVDRVLYRYDFAEMVEINSDTGHRRDVARRVCTAEEADWPTCWRHTGAVRLLFEAEGQAVVYENQRWAAKSGWGQPTKGSDRPPWSDASGAPAAPRDSAAPEGCAWEGPWRLDRSVGGGSEGWLYAAGSFADPFREVYSADARVRKRRWVRVFRAIQADTGQPADAGDVSVDIAGFAPVLTRVCPHYPLECLPTLFHLLDVRACGEIGFFAVMIGLALLGDGSVDGKLRLLHDLYDDDGDGGLADEEAASLLRALLRAASERRVVVADSTTPDLPTPTPLPAGTTVSAEERGDGEWLHCWWRRGQQLESGRIRQADLDSADAAASPAATAAAVASLLASVKREQEQRLREAVAGGAATAPTAAERLIVSDDLALGATRDTALWRALANAGVPFGVGVGDASTPGSPRPGGGIASLHTAMAESAPAGQLPGPEALVHAGGATVARARHLPQVGRRPQRGGGLMCLAPAADDDAVPERCRPQTPPATSGGSMGGDSDRRGSALSVPGTPQAEASKDRIWSSVKKKLGPKGRTPVDAVLQPARLTTPSGPTLEWREEEELPRPLGDDDNDKDAGEPLRAPTTVPQRTAPARSAAACLGTGLGPAAVDKAGRGLSLAVSPAPEDGSGSASPAPTAEGGSSCVSERLVEDDITITKDASGKIGITFKDRKVTKVIPGGAGEAAGVQPGMLLREVAGAQVSCHRDVSAAFASSPNVFTIRVLRPFAPLLD